MERRVVLMLHGFLMSSRLWDDVLTPPNEAARMHALARNSTLHVIAGAGHMLPVEAAADAARAISVP